MPKRIHPKKSADALLRRRIARYNARRAIPDFHYDAIPPASFRRASRMPARVKRQNVNYFRCKWCLRLFVLPTATADITRYCSHVCLRHEPLDPIALTSQRSWSRHKMLYFCTECGSPIRFLPEKKWDKHCKLCPPCHIAESVRSTQIPNWNLIPAKPVREGLTLSSLRYEG